MKPRPRGRKVGRALIRESGDSAAARASDDRDARSRGGSDAGNACLSSVVLVGGRDSFESCRLQVRRLLLVCHAATVATRTFAFPGDEPLDDRGKTAARRLAGVLPRQCDVLSSPAIRCRETAHAAGLAEHVEPAIAECDYGTWSGRTLADLQTQEPEAVSLWLTDPLASPHGGETLAAFNARVARWLDGQATASGTAAVITHAGVVKAALVHALGSPLTAFWQIDAAPLAVTELHARDGRWLVSRVNCPLAVGAAS